MEQFTTHKNRYPGENLLDETTQLATILDFIRWGASCFTAHKLFFGHGTNRPIDEAAQLVFHALHLSHDLPDRYLDAVLTASERETVVALLARRINEKKPAAYLTNEAFFCDLPFYVDERVLIPRSPIAELIERNFAPWCSQDSVKRILDIGTGSACIAIASACYFPYAQVDAVDISQEALAVAGINVKRHELSERVRLIQSDLFAEISDEKYDLIISNPPYVSDAEWRGLPEEYRFEPKLGFHGGKTGLDNVLRILNEARNHLTENGILVIEVGSSAELLQQTYPDVEFLWLDFERGGDGVFLLTLEQLVGYDWSVVG